MRAAPKATADGSALLGEDVVVVGLQGIDAVTRLRIHAVVGSEHTEVVACHVGTGVLDVAAKPLGIEGVATGAVCVCSI